MKFQAGKGDSGSSNPNFIKLKDGGFVVGIPRGEPIDYKRAFKPGDPEKFEFQLNFVVEENGALVAKILRGGWKIYSQLKTLSESGWDLEKTYLRISRTGSKMNDTVYTVTPSPKKPDDTYLSKVAVVKLHELMYPGQDQATAPQPDPNDDFDNRF